MGALTIRNLDDHTEKKLRERAAARGVSMEHEARDILGLAVASDQAEARMPDDKTYMESVNRLKSKFGAFDIDLPRRSSSVREP